MQEPSPESKLLKLANALTRSGYGDFFQTLVNELGRILDMEYVMIAEVRDDEQRARTLAVSAFGGPRENFSYDLQGTPCETVPEREPCQYMDVTERFPEDHLLRGLGVQSYTGMPILTSEGQKLGLLAAMSRRPRTLSEADLEILRIAAAQVGAELELSSSQRRIRSLTYEDSVTGLPNRQHLLDWLAKTDDVSSVLLLDIRRFKDINDLHGHVVGDATLYAVAVRLTSRLGDRGFLARLSSDEFVLVPNDQWQSSIGEMAGEVQRWFDQPVISGKTRFHLEVTLGAATTEEHSSVDTVCSGAELLRRAGVSLAEAKALDQSFMQFEPTMVDSRHLRQTLHEKLQVALREDRLSLHFQPQVDLATGRLMGAEVLCRWHDLELGWVSPAQFIPLAEERGLMVELGDWVMRQSCRQLTQWEDSGCQFAGKLSVNISNRQLEDAGFAERVTALLGRRQPSELVLELTETAMMRSPEINLRQMDCLGAMGFAWAIDDFGTGYSSLSFLTRMAARYLKVDGSFVSRIPGSPHDESVIRTIVAMAQALGMELVAEGIETREQLDYLLAIGCRYGQGYFIGHPRDAETFADTWLSKGV